MKNSWLVVLVFFLSACTPLKAAQGGNISHLDPEIQALINRTLGDMIFVDGNSFMMGDQKTTYINVFGDEVYGYFHPMYEDSRPAHKVTLDSYYMSRYEITYGEHDIFTTETGREPTMQRQFGAPWRSPEYPAGVSWQGAHDYCAWLGEQSGLPFALPTEAQWEYAARSRGKVVPFATDTGLIEPGVNYTDDSNRYPYPPGKFPPNPLGFYDMSGNVYEWVADWYDPEYYSKSPGINPQGPETGTEKVYRGGGIRNSPGGSSVVIRGKTSELLNYEVVSWGFRCVINTDQPLPVNEGH